MYKPKPIDTSEIKLPDKVNDLIERLAENNHDIWALQRINEGWTYGPKRDDIKKEHPNLLPYNALTEPEKDYDRNSVLEPLKVIIALGYKIVSDKK